MSEVAERQELVEAPDQEGALTVFKTEKGLDPFLKTVRRQVDEFLADPPSLETRAGRQAYASMAHKVARSKTAVDAVGKELVAELKQLPRTVDAHRKTWRDTLDAWRDEVRGPLNDWEEEEEARKARHQAGIDRMKLLASETDDLDSQELSNCVAEVEAVTVDEAWQEYEAEAHRVKEYAVTTLRVALEKRKQHEAEQEELANLRAEREAREQQEREARIAREAEERARQEASQAAEQREREHQEALAKAQREAEERADRERRQREEAIRREQEEERRIRQEEQRRQSNKDHQARVNREAMQSLIDDGFPEREARRVIVMIATNQVPHITINY